MKISSVSKKVLASALSAAMVVAFAPTVAFGAQAGDKFTVTYDLQGGTDTAPYGGQNMKMTETLTVGDAVNKDVDTSKTKVEFATWSFAGGAFADPADPQQTEFAALGLTYGDAADFDGSLWVIAKMTVVDASGTAHVAYARVDGGAAGTAATLKAATVKYAVSAVANVNTVACTADSAVATATKDYNVAELTCNGAKVRVNWQSYRQDTTNENKIKIQDYTGTLKLGSYAFNKWEIGYDANGDGDFDDANLGEYSFPALADFGDQLDVSSSTFKAVNPLTAYAKYIAPSIATPGITIDNTDAKGYATLTVDVHNNVTGAALTNGGKFVVTSPSGAATELSMADAAALDNATPGTGVITVAAEPGTWTVALVDGNGVTVDSFKKVVSAIKLTGAIFDNQFTAGQQATSAIAYYDETKTTYKAVLDTIKTAAGLSTGVTVDGKAVTLANPAATFYTAAGANALNDTTVGVLPQKGEVTEIAAAYGAAINKFAVSAADKYAAELTFAGLTGAVDMVNPEGTGNGYYAVVTDADGKIVAESYDTDKVAQTAIVYTGATLTNLEPGTYTATLYKVTGATTGGLSDGSPASMKAVSSKTLTIKGVAAPTWTFASNADATKGGTLTLANAAGEGYAVKYSTNGGTTWYTYDTAKGGIVLNTARIAAGVQVKAEATTTDTKADTYGTYSKTVELVGYNAAGEGVNVLKAFVNAGVAQTINKQAAVYYTADADVKAAVAAAEKTFSDAGFVVSKLDAIGNETAWNATIIAGEKAVLSAVAGVAKGEVAKLYAGTTAADGSVTKISEDNNKKAVASIDAVLAAFDANHDADKTNNVLDGKVAYTDAAYYANIDKALQEASAAAVKYAKADVDAAAAVTAQLKDPKTAAAGLEAYAALSSAAKELVAAADVQAAQEAVAAAKLVKAQDRAAAATGKAQVKGATYKIKAKGSKTIKIAKSASGAKVTLKQVSGTKYAKVSGTKVTLKKAAKKGKTYTVKVKAVCGATTTSTVSFKVLVK